MFPSVPALCSAHSAAADAALFAGFIARMAESDFSSPFIIGYGSSPSRCGPARYSGWSDPRSPGSRARSVRTCQVLRPRRVGRALAWTRPSVLPSASGTASAPGIRTYRGSMAGLCVPLSTLHATPRDVPRMTRGQHDSLRLCCQGLAPFTPCRSPGALHMSTASPRPWRPQGSSAGSWRHPFEQRLPRLLEFLASLHVGQRRGQCLQMFERDPLAHERVCLRQAGQLV